MEGVWGNYYEKVKLKGILYGIQLTVLITESMNYDQTGQHNCMRYSILNHATQTPDSHIPQHSLYYSHFDPHSIFLGHYCTILTEQKAKLSFYISMP
jgi:hypothetical protein